MGGKPPKQVSGDSKHKAGQADPAADATFIPARKELKDKVGDGGLDEAIIQQAQKKIDDNPIDFKPAAAEYLSKIKGVLCALDAPDLTDDRINSQLAALIEPVMQLKAHSGMFKFSLLGQVADIGLYFVEHLDRLDYKALNILHIFYDAMTLIVQKDMRGDGGIEGETLYIELADVSQHYLKAQRN